MIRKKYKDVTRDQSDGNGLTGWQYWEYDKRIVLLTKERGRISAFARGAKKATSQYAAACQPFTFGEFSLYEGKNSFNLMWAGVENYLVL